MMVRVLDETKLTQDFFVENGLQGTCSSRPSCPTDALQGRNARTHRGGTEADADPAIAIQAPEAHSHHDGIPLSPAPLSTSPRAILGCPRCPAVPRIGVRLGATS
jgi:hypothetical protein